MKKLTCMILILLLAGLLIMTGCGPTAGDAENSGSGTVSSTPADEVTVPDSGENNPQGSQESQNPGEPAGSTNTGNTGETTPGGSDDEFSKYY